MRNTVRMIMLIWLRPCVSFSYAISSKKFLKILQLNRNGCFPVCVHLYLTNHLPLFFYHTDHIQAPFAHWYVLQHRSLLHIKLYHMDNLSQVKFIIWILRHLIFKKPCHNGYIQMTLPVWVFCIGIDSPQRGSLYVL